MCQMIGKIAEANKVQYGQTSNLLSKYFKDIFSSIFNFISNGNQLND